MIGLEFANRILKKYKYYELVKKSETIQMSKK